MSVKYDVILSYRVIISKASWCNITIFYRIDNNSYIMNITKLVFGIGKRILEKIGSLGNQKLEPKFSGVRKISVRIQFIDLPT